MQFGISVCLRLNQSGVSLRELIFIFFIQIKVTIKEIQVSTSYKLNSIKLI